MWRRIDAWTDWAMPVHRAVWIESTADAGDTHHAPGGMRAMKTPGSAPFAH